MALWILASYLECKVHVRNKSQAPGGETEKLYVHKLKRDSIMEVPPKSTMVEAYLKSKCPLSSAASCEGTKALALPPSFLHLAFHGAPAFYSSCAPLPLHPQLLLTLQCQTAEWQSCPMPAMWLRILLPMLVWCWERVGTTLSTFDLFNGLLGKKVSLDLQLAAWGIK